MKVSIIIPVYNAEKHLKNCIENCKKQSFDDIEIIFINDGSTDKTAEIIAETVKKDHRFRLISLDKNFHQGYARNIGLANASGEYIVFFDVDDEYSPQFVEKMYNKITQDKADMTACKFKVVTEKGNIVEKHEFGMFTDFPKKLYDGFNHSKIKQTRELFNKANVVWDKIYNRNFLLKNNIKFPTDNFYKEDVIFTFRCLFRAKKISILDEFLYTYKINSIKYNDAKFQKDEIFDCFEMFSTIAKDLKELQLFDKYSYAFMNWEIYSLQFYYKILEQRYHEEFFRKLQKSYSKYKNFSKEIRNYDPAMCTLTDKVLQTQEFAKDIDDFIKNY